MSDYSREARTAARWWADKLRDDFTLDNGDPEQHPIVGGMLALARAKNREGLTVAKIDAFERALIARVQVMLDEGHRLGFGVDYHPDPELGDALSDAEIPVSMTALPWKTVMWVRPGSVRVGDGYGVEPRELDLLP